MPELIKNSEHTVVIEGYDSSGGGVARIGGCVVFVKGALRGEICKVRILKAQSRSAYAKPIEIIEPSPHRIVPACPNFGKCGGCGLMHMDYAEELEYKRLRAEDALRRIGGFDIDIPAVTGSDLIEGYRNKAVYAVGGKPGGAFAGFYRERSHDIVSAGHCLIQAEMSHRAAGAVTRWMNVHKIPPYDEKTHSGAVRHVFCRYAFAAKTAQITVVTADPLTGHLDGLVKEVLESCPETSSIILNVNKTPGNTVLAGEFRTLWGDEHLIDELCGLSFKLSPRSFYQVNRGQAEKLYYKAVSLASPGGDTALDLYCGAGTITLLLSRYSSHVTGAEVVPDAIRNACENAKLNGIENADFICADTEKAAERLKSSGIAPAAVIVDPPRKGLSPAVPAIIADMSPSRIVYVSCDPATLARDLKLFNLHGYLPAEAAAFDMFPRCAHIECAVLLEPI